MMKTIKSPREIEQIFKTGKRYNAQTVRLLVTRSQSPLLNGSENGRVAFIAGKRLGTAPLRNRSKRLLREAARAVDLPYPQLDIVCMATTQTAQQPLSRTITDISHLLNRVQHDMV